MRIYFDVSCLNRPADDHSQSRVRQEAEAVMAIMDRVDAGHWEQVSSEIAVYEIRRSPSARRQASAWALMPAARDIAPLTPAIISRAKECEQMSFQGADSLHVAPAEALGADVLLTCDDQILRTARRHRSFLHVRVENPLLWFKEQCDETYR